MSVTPPSFSSLSGCKSYVSKLFNENNIEPKKTLSEFIWEEFVALVAQVLVFGIAFALTSNFLEDKNKAVQIFSEKIGGGSLSELGMVAMGILLVIGLSTLLAKALPFAQAYIDEFIFEIPRAIYAFGASSTAACVCLAIYIRAHPAENLGVSGVDALKLAGGMLAVSFLYGCALSAVFKRNKLK